MQTQTHTEDQAGHTDTDTQAHTEDQAGHTKTQTQTHRHTPKTRPDVTRRDMRPPEKKGTQLVVGEIRTHTHAHTHTH